jgi:inosine/xanthosine triphosphatase
MEGHTFEQASGRNPERTTFSGRSRACWIRGAPVQISSMRIMQLSSSTRFVVGSTNRVKISAVQVVLSRAWPDARCEGVAVHSGVPDQPWGDEETQRGAEGRARAALAFSNADLAVGLEGGVVELPDGSLRTCAWAVAVDREGRLGIGGSLAVPLPESVARRLRAGEELGQAMDAVARTVGTKYGAGAVGILTAGLIDRQRAYEPLVTYALAPWLAADYFTGEAAAPRPFVCTERVRWADVDLVGIMRFSAFTRFVEVAEQELLRAAGLPYSVIFDDPDVWLPRRALSVEYFAPVRIDDLVELSCYVSHTGDSSLTFAVDMRTMDGTFVAAASMTVVAVRAVDFTKRPLPDVVRTTLAPFTLSPKEARAARPGAGDRALERGERANTATPNPLGR